MLPLIMSAVVQSYFAGDDAGLSEPLPLLTRLPHVWQLGPNDRFR